MKIDPPQSGSGVCGAWPLTGHAAPRYTAEDRIGKTCGDPVWIASSSRHPAQGRREFDFRSDPTALQERASTRVPGRRRPPPAQDQWHQAARTEGLPPSSHSTRATMCLECCAIAAKLPQQEFVVPGQLPFPDLGAGAIGDGPSSTGKLRGPEVVSVIQHPALSNPLGQYRGIPMPAGDSPPDRRAKAGCSPRRHRQDAQ